MKKFRMSLVVLITQSLILFPFLTAHAAGQQGASFADLAAPAIDHPPISGSIAPGGKLKITAKVSDNVGVKSVLLYYRAKGGEKFTSIKMVAEIGSKTYAANVPVVTAPGVEYYIQAADAAGNTFLHGHSFSPLTVSVSPYGNIKGADGIAGLSEREEKSKISKWVWIGVGALAVGAIAGGSGSGGGGGGSSADARSFDNGAIVITAPTP
ncbi:MAG: hypothetical protein KUG83_04200 [Gammaproteobacteria bacterium]|nr:hypothetical protein [Gammaproteobacteria bacterium]